MKNQPKVSIIIPLYDFKNWLRFCNDFKTYEQLHYQNFEIILVSDKKIDKNFPKTRIIYTNLTKTGPAEKRDLAIKKAQGEICAFIDDDAYPHPDWIKEAVVHFKNPEIVAVGGPGVTPSEDRYLEKLSGLVYESFFTSGAAQYRFIPLPPRYIDDYPAYNLFVRTDILRKVGGYGNNFYGGEDTFLCLKLIKIGKIYYDPDIIVYHHRRKLFFDLLKQIANVALHRGYFAKRFPDTSRKWFYFLPSLLASAFFFYLAVAFIFQSLFPIFFVSLSFFIILGAISVMDETTLLDSLLVGIGIILVHICYGIFFIKGLLISNLKQ